MRESLIISSPWLDRIQPRGRNPRLLTTFLTIILLQSFSKVGFYFFFIYVQTTGTSRNTQQSSGTARSFTSINYGKIQLTSRNTQQTRWTATHFTTDSRRNTKQSSWTTTRLITEAWGMLQFCNSLFFFIFKQTTSTSTQRTRQHATQLTRLMCKILFFLFINRLQAQAQAHATAAADPWRVQAIF